MTSFADLRLSEPVLRALQDVGYEKPSPIQEQAIPPLMEGRDMIGQAWRTALDPTGEWIPAVLSAADKRLTEIRRQMPDAGGLEIASARMSARH